jgi:hypothetical protein
MRERNDGVTGFMACRQPTRERRACIRGQREPREGPRRTAAVRNGAQPCGRPHRRLNVRSRQADEGFADVCEVLAAKSAPR